MRILFLGDIVAKPGRKVIQRELLNIKLKYDLDMVIANGENAAHGFGITPNIADEMIESGIDVITGGNHSWDKPEIISYMESHHHLLRPQNLNNAAPGRGSYCFTSKKGHQILVINLMARLFMEMVDDPFKAVASLLPNNAPILSGLDAVIVDFHGEATSEKYLMGHYCDGRASLVIGTHTHVPTADHHIMEHGTAYMSDAGMCGDYDSSLGMDKNSALERMLGTIPRPRMSPAEGEATLCGLLLETDANTGLAKKIAPLRIGGALSQNLPDF